MRTDIMFDVETDDQCEAELGADPDAGEGSEQTVAAILERLNLRHLRAGVDAAGLLVTVESFTRPGRIVVDAMLSGAGVGDAERLLLIDHVFAASR